MTGARAREDEVIGAVLSLLGEYFSGVTLLENPDRKTEQSSRYPDLTTDALIRYQTDDDVILFAADVMILAASRKDLAYYDLDKILDPLAKSEKLKIDLLATEPVEPAEVPLILEEIHAAISTEPRTGSFRLREGITFSWTSPESTDQHGYFMVGFVHSPKSSLNEPPGSLADQIAWENSAPLQRKTKAGGQAERAILAGLPYVLILDGKGSEEVIQGTHLLSAFPFTFQMGIFKALGDRKDMVAAILLFDRDGAFSVLKGDLPGFEQITKDLGV